MNFDSPRKFSPHSLIKAVRRSQRFTNRHLECVNAPLAEMRRKRMIEAIRHAFSTRIGSHRDAEQLGFRQ